MSKAVLVMEMPERCIDCPIVNEDYGWCNILEGYINNEERHNQCPLKPMPERDDGEYYSDSAKGYKVGWNDAIKAIDREV